MPINGHESSIQSGYTNYIACRELEAPGQERIGHLDIQKSTIQPLGFASSTPISNLYQTIEIGESHITSVGAAIDLSSVELRPHPGFTKTADYEGENKFIIGKSGFIIQEADEIEYV